MRCMVRAPTHPAPEPHILLFRREKDYQEKVGRLSNAVRATWETIGRGQDQRRAGRIADGSARSSSIAQRGSQPIAPTWPDQDLCVEDVCGSTSAAMVPTETDFACALERPRDVMQATYGR